ncbi:open rectifier potassium channel protein 1 [Teleopsis dalmanni]|uniref:open rectifier potassium channel protein 1 n=1 Tax=Teleopsis dalmanni TaxID=139649 RepID=UPI0018CF1F71|nr:open rectifier potassium channel protein 1 [Teleopsis dalmanni]
MSPKRWILLLIFYISYLMFGASIYYHIEHGEERLKRAVQLKERIEIYEYLLVELGNRTSEVQNEILTKISDYCGKPVTDANLDLYETPYTWTFYHAFFFAFTVCSTVGYGNISPTTTLGRMIMIAYSMIGIPVNGILFAGLGEYFAKTFRAIYRRYKKYKMSRDSHYVPPQLGLITTITIALVPGITLFLLLPAWVFTYFEGWPYSIAFYYSYVTTTTIGFGDFVPTFNPSQPREFGGWFVVYEIFIIIWFIFSLGYLLMIMTFITRGLQSKKLAKLEQQLSTNIKSTQNRIWNGVTKDVGYLRRILNELYIIKFKPVYTEPDESYLLHRSISCPELTMYRVDPPPINTRKRTFSLCQTAMEENANGIQFQHTVSDSELDKFDKQKSFETAEAFRHTTELLAKVVNALATVNPPEEDATIGSTDMYGGYHGFSDSQILASEWSFTSQNDAPKPRGRACSDFNINPKWQTRRPTSIQHNEWTWSGDNDQIQEAINKRYMQRDRQNNFGQPSTDYVVDVEDDLRMRPRVKKFSVPDGLRRIFAFKKRPSQDSLAISAVGETGHRKFSITSVPEHRIPPLDYYSTVTGDTRPTYYNNVPPTTSQSSAFNGSSVFPSDATISAKLPHLAPNGNAVRRGSTLDVDQMTLNSGIAPSYQRNVLPAARKRRESIFTQNPAINTRRASMFPSSSAALSQRRVSLASNSTIQPRRGSLYPNSVNLPGTSNERRPSMFSVKSEKELEVLEKTTIADLIRALEVMHTQAVLDEATSNNINDGKRDPKRRKSVYTDSSDLPAVLSLFGDDTKTLTATAANRLYARRSTIVGTLPSSSFNTTKNQHKTSLSSIPSNVLTRRRPSSVQIVEPPPSYSEKDTNLLTASQSANPTSSTKFKRRFSIRPTTLQIPPGKAPPPGTDATSTSSALASSASQNALQKRLSYRPSPLARELASPTSTTSTASITSTTRLLPPNTLTSPRPSSTHSPLSRIVQISQAQRKSSMPDGFQMEQQTKKSDN